MTIILAGGLITLIILAFLSWPFFRQEKSDSPESRDVAIYQDQLAELDRDAARGVLTEDQKAAAKSEIERRLLQALKREEAARTTTVSRAGRLAVIASLAAIPLAGALIYLTLGTPDGPQMPSAISPSQAREQLAANERHPELDQQIAALEKRLETETEDVDGFTLLARTYARLGEYDNALRAYAQINRLTGGGDAQMAGEMAEVMVLANEGVVGNEARQIFELILEDYPGDPQSVYYLALARAQAGDVPGALADLRNLRENSADGAPWLPAVVGLIAQLSPESLPPTEEDRRFAGPTTEQMRAAQNMSADDRQQMIEGMVEGLAARLAEESDDVEGWKRLARAYEVLGRADDAAAAHREVLKRDPDDAAAKAFLEGR